MTRLIALHPDDNVHISAQPVAAGTDLLGNGRALADAIPAGHKVASCDILRGDRIIKYAHPIGVASCNIRAGEHVHSHNCQVGEHRIDEHAGSHLAIAQATIPTLPARYFQGYRRADGSVGTRNYVGLGATVNCSASVVRRAAVEIEASGLLAQYPHVDGIATFTHDSGCGMVAGAAGYRNLQHLLHGYASHPNIGATLLVGLGCEVMQVQPLVKHFGDTHEIATLTIQNSGGTRATIDKIKAHIAALLPHINQHRRQPCCASQLKVGLQCGGSDGFSALSANPALGRAADLLVGLGGGVILSETPEIFGAEDLLLRRAASPEVAEALRQRLRWWQDYTEQNGASMDNNPSPGNKRGGLTTILEKSLGAVAKAGSTPLNAVYHYGEKVQARGLSFMDSPGYDPVSVTGQIAGGAQLICFTTGRGSAFGSKPAPTIKLASNSALYQSMREDMDIDCGQVLDAGVSLQNMGEQILDSILSVASGQASKSEALGLGDDEFVPWQIGAVM